MIVIFMFLGLIFGSFGNVLISRTISEISVISPRSFCDSCKESLKFYNLIPVFSYFFQKGRCDRCGEKIDIKYTIFELINAVLYGLIFFIYKDFLISLILSMEITIFIVMSVIDMKTYNIYNYHLIILLVLAIFYNLFFKGLNIYKIIISLLIYLVLKVLEKNNSITKIGFGDIYILLILFIQMSIKSFFYYLLLLSILGGVIALILLINYKDRKMKIPYIPIISFSFIVFTIFQQKFFQVIL